MKVLLIQGPNINLLGKREPNIYGNVSYKELSKRIKDYCKSKKIAITIFQSNEEGKIVTAIQKAKKFDRIIINPAAYSHTSIAILDALKGMGIKTIEVHISNPDEREEFRHVDYISLYAYKRIVGKGIDGYFEAIDSL